MSRASLRIVVVGLGFGECFLPIYRDHPDVVEVIPFDTDQHRLETVCTKHGVSSQFTSLDEIIASPEIDAIHLATPIPLHAMQSLEVMRACKHCACAVPMATTLADLDDLIATQRETRRNYMMMETAVYTREFLYVKDLLEAGELGRIQFLRGSHLQDMEGWPPYWMGLPPMHYATHAVAPLLALANTHAATVHCFGSGSMRRELHERYANPYPAETAIFRLANEPAAAEVTRSLFEVAHTYIESFSIYGDRLSFEWQQTDADHPILHSLEPLSSGSARSATWEWVAVPDYSLRLPSEIAHFTREVFRMETPAGDVVEIAGPHGGSHPHLVHEFVSSIIEGRRPYPDAVAAAQWTAAGICAHDSAILGGAAVSIPEYPSD